MRRKLKLIRYILEDMKINLKKYLLKAIENDGLECAKTCAEVLWYNKKLQWDIDDAQELNDEEIAERKSVWDFFWHKHIPYLAYDVFADDAHLGGTADTFFKINKENENICTEEEVKEMVQELKEIYDMRYWV